MLVAKHNGQLIMANVAYPGLKYACPVCNQEVHLRRGKIKVAHFAHCRGAGCSYGEGETEEHLLGKLQIHQWLAQKGITARVEYYLSKISQRPDIMFQWRGQQVVIEFQCSPLSVQRIRERNQGYRFLGIHPYWYLGSPYRRRLGSEKVTQFTQLINGRPGIWYWDTKQGRLRADFKHYHCSLTRRARVPRRIINDQVQKLMSTTSRQPAVSQLATQVWQRHQVPLSCCPLVCHDVKPSWPVMRAPIIFWRIRVVDWLGEQPLFTAWSSSAWGVRLAEIGQADWLNFPCLVDGGLIRQRLITAFTQELCQWGIIALVDQQYVLLKHPHWFEQVSDKILVNKREH